MHKNVNLFFFFFFFLWERGFHTFIYNPQRVPRPLTKRLKSTVVMFFVLSAQPSFFFRRSAYAPGPVNLLYGAGLFKALNIYVSISMPLIWLIYFVPCENYKISTKDNQVNYLLKLSALSFSQFPVKEILKEEGNTAKNECQGQRTYTFYRIHLLRK